MSSGFVSFADKIKVLIDAFTDAPDVHAKWLNTLSYLENCGARKIAACEHPTLVKEMVLKHAAEEFRHAFYLKRQIGRVVEYPVVDYLQKNILGGISSLHYLNALDFQTSRYLARSGFSKQDVKSASYLLVTYAIELRAGELYPIYEDILRRIGSRVTVKSILLEEQGHLEEMQEGLNVLKDGFEHANVVCSFESHLCKKWLDAIAL